MNCRAIGAPESAAASAGDMSRLQSQGSSIAGNGMNGSGFAATAHSGSFAQVHLPDRGTSRYVP